MNLRLRDLHIDRFWDMQVNLPLFDGAKRTSEPFVACQNTWGYTSESSVTGPLFCADVIYIDTEDLPKKKFNVDQLKEHHFPKL